MYTLTKLIHLLRISQWSKTAFVLLGVLYAGDISFLSEALWAAFAFCLISSAVYIYNDIQDREEDRLHPEKCYRPLASGEVSIDFALMVLTCLLFFGLFIGYLISSALMAILGAYLMINMFYNHGLKNVPIFDVLCIASGFLLRVQAGTTGIGLPASWWLTGAATLLSFYIALNKRKLEKQVNGGKKTRKVLKKYSYRFLDFLIALTASVTFLIYLMYVFWVQQQSFYFLLTIPFAAIGLWRFSKLTSKTVAVDDPVILFFQDGLSKINLFCFATLTLVAMYS